MQVERDPTHRRPAHAQAGTPLTMASALAPWPACAVSRFNLSMSPLGSRGHCGAQSVKGLPST